MTGKRIGDHQVGIYKKHRTKLSQEVAAAKVGISTRSARRLEGLTTLPSQREARTWRTRSDPFEAIWSSEIVPMLEATPALTAMTLLEEMQRRYPGKYDDALLRTLQRRVELGQHIVGIAECESDVFGNHAANALNGFGEVLGHTECSVRGAVSYPLDGFLIQVAGSPSPEFFEDIGGGRGAHSAPPFIAS